MAEPAFDLHDLRDALVAEKQHADAARDEAAALARRVERLEARLAEAEARADEAEARADEAEARALQADTLTALSEARARRLADVARRYRTLLATLPDTFAIVFDHDLRYQVVEGAGLRVAGLDGAAMEGHGLHELVDPALARVLEPMYRRTLAGHEVDQEVSHAGRHHLIQFRPLRGQDGAITGGLVVWRDLSRIRRTEEALRRKQADLSRALEQREILLREVYHRVKNNLQVVSSLLSLQSRSVTDPAARRALAASRARVSAMARVHERLYSGPDLARVELDRYVEGLVGELIATYRQDERVAVSLELEAVTLPLETAIPCGLILHELVSNALQHAWPEGGAGRLVVRTAQVDGVARIEVQDDGVGAPETVRGGALGTRLVQSLTAQVEGRLERRDAPGTWWVMELPDEASPDAK